MLITKMSDSFIVFLCFQNSIEPILPDPRYRNGKLFLKTKHHLEKEQHALNHKMKTLQAINEEILAKISHLETSSQAQVRNMSNITKQVSGVDHLHSSMMELLESIETIENKVDNNLPVIQVRILGDFLCICITK